jgi:hypothetical protein
MSCPAYIAVLRTIMIDTCPVLLALFRGPISVRETKLYSKVWTSIIAPVAILFRAAAPISQSQRGSAAAGSDR